MIGAGVMIAARRKHHHTMQSTKIGLYSQTGEVDFASVQAISQAIDRQLREDVCPAWDFVPWSCAAYSSASDVPEDTIPLVILANADQAGALGYHDVDVRGRAYGKVFSDDTLKHGGTVLLGDNSVAVTVSHEACEIVGDRKCNQWVTCSDGTMEALELADRVEGASYQPLGTGASVSNFILPAGFDPNAEAGAKRDFLGMTTRDGEVTPGGYRIYLRPGKEQQEFAALVHQAYAIVSSSKHGAVHVRAPNGVHTVHYPRTGIFVEFGAAYPEHKKAAKLEHAASRAYRRCVALDLRGGSHSLSAQASRFSARRSRHRVHRVRARVGAEGRGRDEPFDRRRGALRTGPHLDTRRSADEERRGGLTPTCPAMCSRMPRRGELCRRRS